MNQGRFPRQKAACFICFPQKQRNIPLWILEKKRTVSILAETVRLNEQVI